MREDLKRGFRLGEWEVRPLEGRILGPRGSQRVPPKVMEVLACLAEQPGKVVERETILRAVWGERAVTDEPLTRVIGDLRQALGDKRSDPRYVETIPKRGYRLLAPVELEVPGKSEDGIRAEPPAVAQPGAGRPLVPALVIGLALAATLAVVLRVVDRGSGAPPPDRPESMLRPSLAVLPFLNLSGNPDDEYFSDGLAETLTHALSRLDGLKVVARTSAFAFKGKAQDVRVIGEKLGVSALLEGSVQRQGDTVRITTQLVSTRDGGHFWSDVFDRSQDNLFAIQDEIAAAVAAELQVTLLSDEAPRRALHATESFEAYDAYLLGRQFVNRRTSDSLGQAVLQFQRAIAIDPGYALAYVGLADAYLLLRYYGNLSQEEMVEKAEPALQRALEIEPDLGEAHASIGLMQWSLRQYEQGEKALQRAISLNPNYATAYFWYGTVLNDAGRPADALRMHRAALDLDPLAPVIHNAVAVSLEKLGDFEAARAQYERVFEIDPNYAASRDRAARLYWSALARLDEAVRLQGQALDSDPEYPISAGLLSELYLDLGDPARAERWLEYTQAIGPSSEWPHRARALLLAYRGESQEARLRLAADWHHRGVAEDTLDLLLRVARDALLERGDPGAALAPYREAAPELFGNDAPVIEYRNYGIAIDLAHLLQLTGDPDRAAELLDRAQDFLDTVPRLGCCGSGIADVEILALGGRRAEALSALEDAVTQGWRRHWWWDTTHNPNLESLYAEARFRAAVERLEAEIRSTRARLAGQEPEIPAR